MPVAGDTGTAEQSKRETSQIEFEYKPKTTDDVFDDLWHTIIMPWPLIIPMTGYHAAARQAEPISDVDLDALGNLAPATTKRPVEKQPPYPCQSTS